MSVKTRLHGRTYNSKMKVCTKETELAIIS